MPESIGRWNLEGKKLLKKIGARGQFNGEFLGGKNYIEGYLFMYSISFAFKK
jgi:hypothetical protein